MDVVDVVDAVRETRRVAMMERLFDSSSIVALVLERGGAGVDLVFDGYVLDLKFYEFEKAF